MRTVAVILTFVAGCYSPAYRDCEITCPAPAQACPSGFDCVLGICREPGATRLCPATGDGGIDADPNGDADNDRVPNGLDNCPADANFEQYDEDGDAVGDVCDPCPINELNTDADGDGVGEGCDPIPNVGTEQLLFFDGFNVPPTGITVVSGNAWTLMNGKVTLPGLTSHSTLAFSVPLMPTARTHFIYTRLTIDSIAPTNAAAGAGVVDNYDAQQGSGQSCIVGFDPQSQNGLLVTFTSLDSESVVAGVPADPTVGEGVSYDLRAFRTTDTAGGLSMFYCLAGNTDVIGNSPIVGTTGQVIGIHARHTQATYDYLMVVDTPRIQQ